MIVPMQFQLTVSEMEHTQLQNEYDWRQRWRTC
jgi:hypothetical protein